MKIIKEIPVPKFKSAQKMTAAEMNTIHFGGRHTVVKADVRQERLQ